MGEGEGVVYLLEIGTLLSAVAGLCVFGFIMFARLHWLGQMPQHQAIFGAEICSVFLGLIGLFGMAAASVGA